MPKRTRSANRDLVKKPQEFATFAARAIEAATTKDLIAYEDVMRMMQRFGCNPSSADVRAVLCAVGAMDHPFSDNQKAFGKWLWPVASITHRVSYTEVWGGHDQAFVARIVEWFVYHYHTKWGNPEEVTKLLVLYPEWATPILCDLWRAQRCRYGPYNKVLCKDDDYLCPEREDEHLAEHRYDEDDFDEADEQEERKYWEARRMLVRSTIVELRRAAGASSSVAAEGHKLEWKRIKWAGLLHTVQECLGGDDPVQALTKFSETDRWLEEDAMEEAQSPGGVTAAEARLWTLALRLLCAHLPSKRQVFFDWLEDTHMFACVEDADGVLRPPRADVDAFVAEFGA